MKKFLTFFIAISIMMCICGCKKSNKDSLSSDYTIIEYDKVIIDENANETISANQSTDNQTSFSENENSSSTPINNNNIVIDFDTVTEVDLCDDIVRSYLDASNPSNQYHWLSTYSDSNHDYQNISLDWYLDGSSNYKIYFSENSDFSNSYIVESKTSKIENTILIPGKTYYWKVIGTISSELLGGGKIHIKDEPVRWIQIDGTGNVRDMGGWTAENGKKVKYGMLYRGQKIDSITENGISTIKLLGLKTELDLRYERQKYQAQGTGMNYVFLETNQQYDDIYKGDFTASDEVKTNYKKIFELLSDESNYPFYAHCSGGADRTGTYAFILNGVLGVSYEDLTRDFELTSFSSSGKRWRGSGTGNTFAENDTIMMSKEDMKINGNYVAWGELYKGMMEYGKQNGCTTLQSSIEHFLVNSVGVPQSQINSFKSIVLE